MFNAKRKAAGIRYELTKRIWEEVYRSLTAKEYATVSGTCKALLNVQLSILHVGVGLCTLEYKYSSSSYYFHQLYSHVSVSPMFYQHLAKFFIKGPSLDGGNRYVTQCAPASLGMPHLHHANQL